MAIGQCKTIGVVLGVAKQANNREISCAVIAAFAWRVASMTPGIYNLLRFIQLSGHASSRVRLCSCSYICILKWYYIRALYVGVAFLIWFIARLVACARACRSYHKALYSPCCILQLNSNLCLFNLPRAIKNFAVQTRAVLY